MLVCCLSYVTVSFGHYQNSIHICILFFIEMDTIFFSLTSVLNLFAALVIWSFYKSEMEQKSEAKHQSQFPIWNPRCKNGFWWFNLRSFQKNRKSLRSIISFVSIKIFISDELAVKIFWTISIEEIKREKWKKLNGSRLILFKIRDKVEMITNYLISGEKNNIFFSFETVLCDSVDALKAQQFIFKGWRWFPTEIVSCLFFTPLAHLLPIS